MSTVSILEIGDCKEILPKWVSGGESVTTCVTSPPYFNLRKYTDSPFEIGNEATVKEYVSSLADVFYHVHELLSDDGTLWVNIGDTFRDGSSLCVPWELVFALKERGWNFVQEVIWYKKNAMPSSVTKRLSVNHEYLFLFSKTKDYYFDYKAIEEPAVYAGVSRGGSKKRYEQNNAGMDNKVYNTRRKRSVWEVNVKPKKFNGEKHHAVFPKELITPCILSTTRIGDTVLDPFSGSHTTREVSSELSRNFMGCELNPKFSPIT